jgi:16S rRNA C967 or C1407 C5-methylase (RsmB/RsmF family)
MSTTNSSAMFRGKRAWRGRNDRGDSKRGRGGGGGGGGGSGGGGGGGGGGGDGGGGDAAAGGGGGEGDGERGAWPVLPPSASYEPYYRAQGLIPDAEWAEFMASWSAALPVTFRVNPLAPDAGSTAGALRAHPQWSVPFHVGDGRVLPPPREFSWLPGAWQLGYGKQDLRRNAPLKAFHEWLITLTAAGTVSRQEAVSMVPPLLLDVQPGHHVLDMCAAPGSKTAQLLEALHAGEVAAPGAPPAGGMVVANDSDSKRAYMLTHQCQRIGSPALVVSCHDAQLFPNLNPRRAGGAGEARGRAGCFDRVLADVPCSGDGTARKNKDVLPKWTPAVGLSLHPLQVQITMRGLSLLRVGGLLAYSTCSLNPIEDEAVVAELLRRCDGAVELVDVADKLPGLVRSPGVSTWAVMDKDLNAYKEWKDVNAPNRFGHTSKASRRIMRSMFPPAPHVAASLHLHRALRILPHANDTGGFFICLLRKTRELPSSVPWYDPPHEDAAGSGSGGGGGGGGGGGVEAEGAAGAAAAAAAAAAAVPPPAPSPPAPLDEEEEGGGGAAAPAAERAGEDSEAEIDAAVAKPFYGRAMTAEAASAEAASARGGADALSQQWRPPREPRREAGGEAPTALDSKGRALTGRFELTVYNPLAPAIAEDVVRFYGMLPSFPRDLLYSRADSAKHLTLLAEPVARVIMPQQKLADGQGRVKVVNTGIKVLSEAKGDLKKRFGPAAAAAEEEAPAAEEAGALPCAYRMLQSGASFLLPYMTRQVAHVSGPEFVHILRYRGQFVHANAFTPRLQLVFAALGTGSFLVILNPALGGFEDRGWSGEGAPTAAQAAAALAALAAQPGAAGVPTLAQAVDIAPDGSCVPKERVPAAGASAIAPALRPHYAGQPDGSFLYQPGERVFAGTDPVARLYSCMWKGVHRINLMVDADEGKSLNQLLCTAGFAPPLAAGGGEAPAAAPAAPAAAAAAAAATN